MKKLVFNSNLKKRKEILHKVSKTDPTWKFRVLLVAFLFSASAIILIATGILLALHPTSEMGIFIFICFGIMMACVPFFIALSSKNKAKYKCAYPYSSYANGMLVLEEEYLQYFFWQVGPREAAAYSSPHAVFEDEDKFIYQISKEAIRKILIDENGVCTIYGNGKIITPKWAKIPKSEINELSKEFSLILAFDDDNSKEKIENWRNL